MLGCWYNLIKYSHNYLERPGSLWQYCRDEPHDIAVVNSEWLMSMMRITGKTRAAGNTKDVKIAVTLKYLSNFGELLKCL